MPNQILVDPGRNQRAVLREFTLLVPEGWQDFLRQLVDDGEDGLPLVVALHGGGSDPEAFQQFWDFTQVWASSNPRIKENQFIVVYPHGWSSADAKVIPEATSFAPQPTFDAGVPPAFRPALAADAALIEGVALELPGLTTSFEKLAKVQPRRPVARWNPGWVPVEEPQDDVAFVRQLLDEVERYLAQHLGTIHTHAIDPWRRYLVGYGEGGMLAYRLVSEMPNVWAAVHVMSASIGGRLHARLPPEASISFPVAVGDMVSLFAHHGGSELVPPGLPDDDYRASNDLEVPPGTALDFLVELAGPDAVDRLVYPPSGVAEDPTTPMNLPPGDASRSVHLHAALATAIALYKTANLCHLGVPQPAEDRLGGQTAQRTIHTPTGVPDPAENPIVVEYRDPTMNHTNWFDPTSNHYLDVHTIWEWLRAHPRVLTPV